MIDHIYGVTHFCDDIREEVGGKTSYMGVYSQHMVVIGLAPIRLPKLAIAGFIYLPAGSEAKDFSCRVISEINGIESIIANTDVTDVEFSASEVDETYRRIDVQLAIVPFDVHGTHKLRVVAELNSEVIEMGIFKIFLKPPSGDALG